MPDPSSNDPMGQPEPAVVPLPLADCTLHYESPVRVAYMKSALWGPLFSQDEAKKLEDRSHVQSLTDESGRKWRPLSTWLEASSSTAASVLCRKSGLTVQLKAGVDPKQVLLLPIAGKLQAVLKYTAPSGVEEQQAFGDGVRIDEEQGSVQVILPFVAGGDGAAQYERVIAAMDRSESQARVELSCQHAYTVRVPVGSGTQPGNGGIRPRRPVRIPFGGHVVPEDAPPASSVLSRLSPEVLEALRPLRPEIRGELLRPVPIERVRELGNLGRFVLPHGVLERDPGEAGEPQATTKKMNLKDNFTVSLLRRIDQNPGVFPDLPGPNRAEWSQLSVGGRPAIYFKGTERFDTYLYVPTSFRCGFFVPSLAQPVRPPLYVSTYLDSSGQYRVKATLTAVPFLDDADREALRSHILTSVLKNTMPFVQLQPAGGLSASFAADFSPATSGSGPQVMPANIRYTISAGLEAVLVFEFDMSAVDESYAIFCELLRRGLSGRVMLKEGTAGLQTAVDVLLCLDQPVGHGLSLQLIPSPAGDEGASPAISRPQLRVENLLPYPVQIASLVAYEVARGEDLVPGLILEAQGQNLLAGGPRELAQAGTTGAQLALDLPAWQSELRWKDLVVSLGDVIARAGTTQEWLDRVHHDPSLQQHAFRVKVRVLFAPLPDAAAADPIEFVQVRLYTVGNTNPREQRQVRRSDDAWDLTVHMTLFELAGSTGKLPQLVMEHYTVYKDGRLGLPQRTPLTLQTTEVSLLSLSERADSRYVVEASGTREDGPDHKGLTAAETQQRITALLTQGQVWALYLAAPPAETPENTVTGTPTAPQNPTQPTAGATVAVVTELLAPMLSSGIVKMAFVTLQPAPFSVDTPMSTFRFDAQSSAPVQWMPATGTVPPFKFKIVYVYENGSTKSVEGIETNVVLLLDPPAA